MRKALSLFLVFCMAFSMLSLPWIGTIYADSSNSKEPISDGYNEYGVSDLPRASEEVPTVQEHPMEDGEILVNSDPTVENIDCSPEMPAEEGTTEVVYSNSQQAVIGPHPLQADHRLSEESTSSDIIRISVDKIAVPVGATTSITVTATTNGAPYANVPIKIGNYSEGITNENGIYTCDITPTQRGNIIIYINGYTFYTSLFSINNDEGVVEVTAEGRSGFAFNNFKLTAKSQNMHWGVDSESQVARAVAKQGFNSILVSYAGYPFEDSYYLAEDIVVAAGQVNKIHLNANTNTVEANFDVMLSDQPLQNAQLDIIKADSLLNMSTRVGWTDSFGKKRIYITPGIYTAAVKAYQSSDGILYFRRTNLVITSNSSHALAADINKTGKVNLNYGSVVPASVNKWIYLDGMQIDLEGQNSLILEQGSYQVDKIGVNINYDNTYSSYEFTKHAEAADRLDITAGNIIDFTADLGLKDVKVNVHTPKIQRGNQFCFNVDIETNSGYYVDYIRNFNATEVQITKPNQQVDSFTGDFRHVYYAVKDSDPEGQYIITTRTHLGPLYNMIYTVHGFVQVTAPRELVIDKPILLIGSKETIRFAVTSKGVPVANEEVYLDGSLLGKTDSNGGLSYLLDVKKRGSYSIRLGSGYTFSNLLFGINADEGVVEVTLRDMSGGYLENFSLHARSENMWWSTGAYGKTARTLAREGSNILKVAGKDKNGNNYYVLKEVSVTRGIANIYNLDSAQETIKADMSYYVDRAPLPNTEMFIKLLDSPYNFDTDNMGWFDSNGNRSIYVTPGNYDVAIRHVNSQNEVVYLNQRSVPLMSKGSYTLEFNMADTGKIHIDLGSSYNSLPRKWVKLDGSSVYLGNSQTLVMMQAIYTVDNIYIEINNNDRWISYEYSQLEETKDTLDTLDGKTASLAADLALKEAQLKVYNSSVNPSNYVSYALLPITNGGYYVSYIQNSPAMNVTIRKPDGKSTSLKQDFRYSWYYVSSNDPLGTYEINASMYLGPLYDSTVNASAYFNVVGKREVTIDKPVITVGEESQVTFTVTSNGLPVPNEPIHIGSFASGTTDANGIFTVTLRPNYSQYISIMVGNSIIFNDIFHSVYPNQGVIEITAKNMAGGNLYDFTVNASNQNGGWTIYSGDHIGRVIATEGHNKVIVSHNKSKDEDGYYMVKDIEVTPGVTNYLNFDSVKDTIEANLNFNTDGQPIGDAELRIRNTSNDYYPRLNYVGYIKPQGSQKVHVTPGNYDIAMRKISNGESTYLKKENQALLSNGDYIIGFATSNLGKITFDFGPGASAPEKWVYLDDEQVSLGSCSTIVLEAKPYSIGNISIGLYDSSNRWINYSYFKPGDPEVINVLPNTSTAYNADLKMKDISLRVHSMEVSKETAASFEVVPITNSGYQLSYAQYYNLMNVLITKPDGSTASSSSDFRSGSYYVSSNDPAGVYIIEATGDFGPYYSTYKVIGSFEVIGEQHIKIVDISPADSAQNVPVDTSVSIWFNEPVQQGTRYDEIVLKNKNGTVVPSDVKIFHNTLHILPKVKLNYNSSYELFLPVDSIVNANGRSIESDFIYGFTTITDKTAPAVVNTTPASNAINIDISTPISIEYDEAIAFVVTTNRTTAPKVTLKAADGTIVPIIYSCKDNMLTIAPKIPLKSGTKYTVTVPAGVVADRSKNVVKTSYSFSFTTKAATLNKTPIKR